MALDRVRIQQSLVRLAKSGPGRMRGPVGRATRRFRGGFDGPMVSVVLPVSDDETTRIGPMLDQLREQFHRNLDVIVVPYGRHDRVVEIARTHAVADWRIRVRRRVEPSLATARNAGVAAARADLVLVVAGGDELLPRGIGRLVGAHRETGSPLVVGRMKEPRAEGKIPGSPYDAAHHVDVRRTTLAATPVAITDLGIGNKLFTRALWREAGLAFTEHLPSGTDVAIGLLRAADSFDLLKEWTYLPSGRKDGVGLGTAPDVLNRLADWIEAHERTWREVEELALPDVRDWWLWGVLDAAVQPLLLEVERAGDEQWETLRNHVSMLLESADAHLWSTLSAESRVKLWLLQHDHREQLADFVAARLLDGGNRPTAVRDGKVWAQLPFHDDAALGVPTELYEMTEDETRLKATLREVRWQAERAELLVFAAIDFVHMSGPPTLTCALVDQLGGQRLELPVRLERDWRANQAARRYQDFSWGAFVAEVAVTDLVAATLDAGLGEGRTWTVEVEMTVDGVTRAGQVADLDDQGSAGFLGLSHLAPRPVAGALVALLPRSTVAGFRVLPETGARLRSVEVAGRTVSGVLDTRGVPLVAVRASGSGQQARGDLGAEGAFRLELPPPHTSQAKWSLHGLDAAGKQHPIGWPAAPEYWPGQWLGVGGGSVVASRDHHGRVELAEADRVLVADRVTVEGLDVTLEGRWLAAEPPVDPQITLVGPKAELVGALDPAAPAGTARVRFVLESDPWGLGPMPVPHGWYWFKIASPQGPLPVPLGEAAIDQMHHFQTDDRFTARVVRAARETGIELTRPLVEHRPPYNQWQLERMACEDDIPLAEDAVYFQAYGGSSATDSQLAVHEELRRVRPDLKLYWGVLGSSSWVPEGGIPVVINGPDYYRTISSAKYLCMNVDPPRWFDRRPGQKLLQTFHGYPSKSMGLRMWRAKHFTPRRIALELHRTSGEWDLILTPAPEMDEHYRREYAYDGPIHSAGYPRDDLLVSDQAGVVREDTRRRLGIRPEQKVVLYAPTWRDDLATSWGNAEMVQHLDLEAASRALGPDYVLLMRGHRFHSAAAAPPGTAAAARFLDVTDYPEINHLILAADAAVLDYSSLRFDFALTMRPMVFLVPDLDTYVGGVRGFLYDYRDSAPGPLVDTAEEAVRLLRDLPGLQERCAPELTRFHEKYNYLQDGHAAERVVRAFFTD